MRGVHHQHVHAGGDQRLDAAIGIAAHADGRTDQQAGGGVLGGVGVVGLLLDVLDRDQAAQGVVAVDHQHLLDAVAVQQLEHFLVAGALAHGDQPVLLGHDVADRVVQLGLEAHVAAGDDAGQLPGVIHHRHAGDVAGAGQRQHLADGGVGPDRDRIADDAGLELLDLGHLGRLLLCGQVLVQDADAAELGHGYGQAGFGDGVHRRRHDRQVDAQVTGEPGAELDILRQHDRMGGDEGDVVVGKCFGLDAQHRQTLVWGSEPLYPPSAPLRWGPPLQGRKPRFGWGAPLQRRPSRPC